VKILADVNATVVKERKQNLEAGPLVACDMATVVKHDINTAHF